MGIAMMVLFLSPSWLLSHLENLSIQWKFKQFAELMPFIFSLYLCLPPHSPAPSKRTFKSIEIQLELKSCRKWRIIAWPNVICTFSTFRIVREILSHRNTSAHPSQFLQHRTYVLLLLSEWVSECLCVRAVCLFTTYNKDCLVYFD